MGKVRINISLDEVIKDKMQIIAKEQGLSVSALITNWVNTTYEEKQPTRVK